jgi:hypothetical protein
MQTGAEDSRIDVFQAASRHILQFKGCQAFFAGVKLHG